MARFGDDFRTVICSDTVQAIEKLDDQNESWFRIFLDLVRLGLSSKEVAAELHIAEGTVNNHVAAILQVFDAGTRAHAVAKAIELGLLEAHPQTGTPESLRALVSGRR